MKRILIIDDREDVRLVVKTTLRQFGFTTVEAANGPEGVQKAITYLPDLIICDVNMDGMDGFGTLEAVRALSLFSTTPFILMTGTVGPETFRRSMACGADDFLQKPFKAQDLIEAVVSRLVRHSQIQAEVEKRAEQMRFEALEQISRKIAAPISESLGATSSTSRRRPSRNNERIVTEAHRLNESVKRLSQPALAHAH